MRQSIQPTYDHRETGDRFTVETRVNDRRISLTPCRDPFVYHRVTVGWSDLLRSLLRGKLEVVVVVSGDREIIDDVMELDADCLTYSSTRRQAWDRQVNDALAQAATPIQPPGTHTSQASSRLTGAPTHERSF